VLVLVEGRDMKILMSGCLLGERVRFDARIKNYANEVIQQWLADKRIISVCPEVQSGMPVPRLASEIEGGDGKNVLSGNAKVISTSGANVTNDCLKGANIALELCKKHHIKIAVLKESSPSCGSHQIYNGQFKGIKREGVGVTTALLMENGIRVFSELELIEADKYLMSFSN